jgi:group I intron endonuclease
MIINSNIKEYNVYGLKDPNNDCIRYIGITKKINIRLKQHLKDKKNSHKKNWINSLKNKSMNPEIILIEDNLTLEDALCIEKKYIMLFKSFGAKLVNLTIGGEAPMANKKHSTETKNKMKENRKGDKNSFYGKKHTQESLEKISLKLKNRSTWSKGIKFSESHKLKLSIAKKNKKPSNFGKTRFDLEKIRDLYKEGYKQKEIALMYKTDGGTISRIVNKINYK